MHITNEDINEALSTSLVSDATGVNSTLGNTQSGMYTSVTDLTINLDFADKITYKGVELSVDMLIEAAKEKYPELFI